MKKQRMHIRRARPLGIDRQSLKALAHSVRAGISPREALLYIADSRRGRARSDLIAIADMFRLGTSYSDAFQKTILSRQPLFMQILRISESNGQIAKALDMIVGHIAESSRTRSQIIGLSIYPIIVALMTVAFLAFALFVIVPNIRDIILMPGADINIVTRAMLAASDLVIHSGVTVLCCLAAFVAAMVLASRVRIGRVAIESVALRFPVISRLASSYSFGAYAAFIALYSDFRSDIGTAFELLSGTSRFGRMRAAFQSVAASVKKGEILSDAIASHSVIPRIWPLFASVAERSSSYREMFGHLAAHHAESLDHYSKICMKMLEPVLMICVGALVGILAYGILSPLYGLMQHVR